MQSEWSPSGFWAMRLTSVKSTSHSRPRARRGPTRSPALAADAGRENEAGEGTQSETGEGRHLRQQHVRDAEGAAHLYAEQCFYCRRVAIALITTDGGDPVVDFDALEEEQPAEVDEFACRKGEIWEVRTIPASRDGSGVDLTGRKHLCGRLLTPRVLCRPRRPLFWAATTNHLLWGCGA